jgi:hypothetical protein
LPVFDGLFPDRDNQVVQDLLFVLAHWHGLAKLRMHTDYTLNDLSKNTTSFGDQLRLFATTTCTNYNTFELPREASARRRRKPKKSQGDVQDTSAPVAHRTKQFNMETYKLHALGDYVATIRTFGTCDSYSTELVCADTALVSSVISNT